ncbi:MAG TPA: anti-sigma factor [Vicinamibacterales bacterium]|nr:anti-sigma factor [Vicinamibacterales bacterium]
MSDHDALRSLAGAYALGVASEAERREFEAHLSTCAECRQELAEIRRVNEALAIAGPPAAAPPADLRRRILDAAERGRQPRAPARSMLPWWIAAAASIAAVFFGAQWWTASRNLADMRAELASTRERLTVAESLRASAERTATENASRLAVLTAADSITIFLAGQPPSPNATGRVVWSPTRGVIFSAANLPPVPAGRVYQLWAVTARAPVGLMLVTPAAGQADALAAVPAGVAPTAFALTIEPEGGSPGPTGPMYLLGSR